MTNLYNEQLDGLGTGSLTFPYSFTELYTMVLRTGFGRQTRQAY